MPDETFFELLNLLSTSHIGVLYPTAGKLSKEAKPECDSPLFPWFSRRLMTAHGSIVYRHQRSRIPADVYYDLQIKISTPDDGRRTMDDSGAVPSSIVLASAQFFF
jgi:hypothetical protein